MSCLVGVYVYLIRILSVVMKVVDSDLTILADLYYLRFYVVTAFFAVSTAQSYSDNKKEFITLRFTVALGVTPVKEAKYINLFVD